MKAFKYYTFLFILVLVSTLLLSCVSNGGSDPVDPDPDPEEPIDLTMENLYGKWEVGYFTKAVGATSPQRDPVMDGFVIEFLKDKTYTETNSLGESNVVNGRYRIIDERNIELTSEIRPEEDTIIVLRIVQLTEKIMLRQNDYKKKDNQGVEHSIRDIQYLRNLKTAPNETFGKQKSKTITPEYIKGEWTLDTIYLRTSADGINYTSVKYDDSKDRNLRNKFTFNTATGNFVELINNGTGPENKGEFILVEDVIHYYYYDKDEEGVLNGEMAPMHINILPETANYYLMEDFARRIVYLKDNKVQVQEFRSIFNKKKN